MEKFIQRTVLYTSLFTVFTTALSTLSMTNGSFKLPKLIAFDLDGTIWTPDMYQLWGGGAPFTVDGDGTKKLMDRSGTPVKLLGISSQILQELKTDPKWAATKTAWVSCTDEPEWAAECLLKFKTKEGQAIGSYIDSSQIYKANKKQHFRELKKQYESIEYSEMLFFDNESGNIRSVSELGVQCVYCPDGMTEEIWQQGLARFL